MSGKYRNDVNQTQVDLCYVWKPTWTSWVIVDPIQPAPFPAKDSRGGSL
jgi:hypothetical protein